MNGEGRKEERRVLETAVAALDRNAGLSARARAAEIEVVAGRRKYRFAAEVKTADRFETPAMVKAEWKGRRKRPLLVAPYITREIAARCRELRLPFIDTAGNAYLEGPGLLVYVEGRPRPEELRAESFRALNPAGLRVSFALLCRPELAPAGYREIAAAAGVSLGTVGPVMKDLVERGFVRRTAAGRRELRDPGRMLQEWVTHYPSGLRPKLNARRFQADPERLRRTKIEPFHARWGGEFAAEKSTQYLKAAQYTIYAREPVAKLAAAARMRADRNGNVEILDAFWNFDAGTGAGLVPPTLVYADLLTSGDGRNAEAARLIYEQQIEPAFRGGQQTG